MSLTQGADIGFWRTLWLLLKAARRRATGRQQRQRQLWGNRAGSGATNWGGFGWIVGLLFMAIVHGLAAATLVTVVELGQRLEVERQGRILVSEPFLALVMQAEHATPADRDATWSELDGGFAQEAARIARREGRAPGEVEQALRATVAGSGSQRLIAPGDAEPGLTVLGAASGMPALLGSLVLLWWFAMLVCQGEGLELDLQRRRHPMWEWLFSHPVRAGPVFLAEMLAPLSANPIYLSAPLFVAILFGLAQGAGAGLAAALLIGIPLTLAAACLGKAIEIGAILRLPPRSRGLLVGLLSWFGYASMMGLLVGVAALPRLIGALARGLPAGASALPWPWLAWLLGLGEDGQFSFFRSLVAGWIFSGLAITVAIVFSARSVRQGLSGAAASDQLPARPRGPARFGREPLFHKEYLWFVRDRSAVVQTLLIPLTVAGFQMINLRGVFRHAQDSWNYLCGAAIFFGTYFLWVLGPKSLSSEGSSLWLALTWPRGLESMLKAKAWLWSLIASGLVFVVLAAGCWFFPHDAWKIGLVGAGWFVFARSMAEKSVTLVTVVADSGEVQKVPSGRRWAAQLGMLTFAVGVISGQWNLAIVGIVYSWITAAAMWENLRARLPYLYDPWSERLPEPPTLMHAMVSISILVECASVMTMLAFAFAGPGSHAAAMAIAYAVCAVGVSIGVSDFLSKREVHPAQIWCWRDAAPDPATHEGWFARYVAGNRRDARWLAVGIAGGLVLGLLAHFYLQLAAQIPVFAEAIHAARRQMQNTPGLATGYAVAAIGFAPFAEEYLFRGLVFRTLDRQWGGWRALLGASAFFAIYHPALAWFPVGLVGAANCMLFKRSRRLAPAVLLHITYNAVVTGWSWLS